MDIIKTAQGKTFNTDYFATMPYPARAYIRVLDTPIAMVAAVFSNPAETAQLWCGQYYLAQHTRLVSIMPEQDAVKVCLAKE